jgi:hypothetical protein
LHYVDELLDCRTLHKDIDLSVGSKSTPASMQAAIGGLDLPHTVTQSLAQLDEMAAIDEEYETTEKESKKKNKTKRISNPQVHVNIASNTS